MSRPINENSYPNRLRVYLMRHGESEQQALPVYYGQTDIALSSRGIEQSHLLRDALSSKALVAVYSSDLARAVYAARLIARAHDIELIIEPSLREINMGNWEGQSVAEINSKHPDKIARLFRSPRRFRYPGGESFAEFERRVSDVLQRILKAHHEGDIAVVTHGGVCRVMLGKSLELSPKNWLRISQDFGCLNVIDWHRGVPFIKTLNFIMAELP